MTVYTTTPSSILTSDGTWTVTGGGTVLGAIQDSSDSTYVTCTALPPTGIASFWLNMGESNPAAGETRWRQRVITREMARGDGSYLGQLLTGTAGVAVNSSYHVINTAVIADIATPWGQWKDTTDSRYVAIITDTVPKPVAGSWEDNCTRIYKITVQSETTSIPSVTVAASGTPTTTYPTFDLTYADTAGWAHTATEIKVFTAAQYGAGGFNPATSTAFYTFSSPYGPVASHTMTTAVSSGTTYRCYARVAKTVNGALVWSAWANNAAWTPTIVQPDAPVVTATWDTPTQAAVVTVISKRNMLTDNQSSFETDTTGWASAANCSIARSTSQAKYDTASLALTSGAGGNMSAGTLSGTSGVPVVAGRSYVAQFYARAAVSARSVRAAIVWYDSAGSGLTTSTGSSVSDSAANFNTLASVVATAPANAAYGRVTAEVLSTGGASEVHYIDGVLLAHGTATVAWHPGGSTPGIGVWVQDPDTSEWVGLALAAADYYSASHHWAWRGRTVNYRAQTVCAYPSSTISSEYGTGSVATSNDGTWWVKAVTAPALNTGNVRVQGPMKVTQTADVGVFRPLQGDTIVVSGRVYGEDGELEVFTIGASEFAALSALFAHNGKIVLLNPDGRQKVINWSGERSWEETYAGGTTRRRITAPYVEVSW